ncbi:MAG: hypothetical protein AAFZ17_03335 [Cyanobacteria bacterium J06650_10]
MNASAQALSIEMVSKIASISTIVQTQFPSVLVDFSPWVLSEQTQKQYDPDSIDLAFSFPTWQPHLSCSCILLQIYFVGKVQTPKRSLRKIKITGHDYRGQHWQLSTHANCQFSGPHVPSPIKQQQIKAVINQLFILFDCAASLPL